jgi:hypothetical protein
MRGQAETARPCRGDAPRWQCRWRNGPYRRRAFDPGRAHLFLLRWHRTGESRNHAVIDDGITDCIKTSQRNAVPRPGILRNQEFFDFIVNDIVSPDFGRCFDMLTRLQLPQMNKFPNDRSVLILDNCAIHKSEYLREIIEAQGFSHTSLLVNLLICSRLCPSVSSAILAGF